MVARVGTFFLDGWSVFNHACRKLWQCGNTPRQVVYLIKGVTVFQAGYNPRGAYGSVARDMNSTGRARYVLSTTI